MKIRMLGCLFPAMLVATVVLAQDQPSYGSPQSLSPANSATKNSSPAERIILKVGNVEVTEEEFEASIADFEPDKEANSQEDRRKFGDDYASVLMLSQQAVADHLDTSPEVRRQLEIARIQTLSNAAFNALMQQAKPSPDDISKYYSEHLSEYDEVQIRRLFIWKEPRNTKTTAVLTSQEARAVAAKIQKSITAGKDAKTVAQELKDSGAGQFDVELLSFPRGELPQEMEKVAFALKNNEWGEVADTKDSIMVVQLVNRSRRPLAEVSPLIGKQLQAERAQAKLNDLKTKTGIWMDEQYFGTAAASAPEEMTPASGLQPKTANVSSGPKGERE